MCLAIPAQVMAIEGVEAEADLHGSRMRVNIQLVPEVQVGDFILIHAGFAIQRMDCQTAEETFAVIEDLQARLDAEGAQGSGQANRPPKDP